MDRRGKKLLQDALRMYRFHRTPFEEIIVNMGRILEKHGARYTFPTVASVAGQKPELLRGILESGNELAVHGFRHLRYSLLSEEAQKSDIERAGRTFRRLGLPFTGFRAPYNDYTDMALSVLEAQGFRWDGGFGYREEYRKKADFFRIPMDGRESKIVYIPVCAWTDDTMIDRLGLTPAEISKTLKRVLDVAHQQRGLVMFDLHPIRIGQPEYIRVLDEIIAHGTDLNAWFPTVTEAVDHRTRHPGWKGDADFCCLLTGDIDNFAFLDYLRRIL